MNENRILATIHKVLLSIPRSWYLTLTAAASTAYLAWTRYFSNQYGIYSLGHWNWLVALIPIFFVGITFGYGLFFFERVNSLSRRRRNGLILLSGLFALGFAILFPPSQPALSLQHELTIRAGNALSKQSSGSQVEIMRIRYLNGQSIDPAQLTVSPGWQAENNAWSTQSALPGKITLTGPMPGGVVVWLKYGPNGGSATITWDGKTSQYDLYAPSASQSNIVLNGFTWKGLSPAQAGLYLSNWGLYVLAIFCITLTLILAAWFSLLRPNLLLLSLLYTALFTVFIKLKLDYAIFASERILRDTSSYAGTASQPWNSFAFWFGERPFTIPLIYKLLAINPADIAMAKVAALQVGLSILCWALLAGIVSMSIRQRWLRPAAFAAVLLFSLSIEVSLWDQLMLSESVSISLLALLLAGWTVWFSHGETLIRGKWRAAFWLLMGLSTVLFTFTRDSNIYLLLLCSAVFTAALLMKKIPPSMVRATAAAIAFILALTLFQSWSLNASNRWQVFIYDHFALRLFKDPQALAFFTKAGLPVSDRLLSITNMIGYTYQDMLLHDVSMAPVREWVTAHGKTVYLQYLLSRPGATLLEPLQQAGPLLNESTSGYLYPRFLPLSISSEIETITRIFYGFQLWMLPLFAICLLIGSARYWLGQAKEQPVWLVLSALLLSLYPLMFIVWHGEPMEIPRHAIQVGIQLRIAGWIAVLLLVDTLISSRRFRQWLEVEEAPQ